MVVTHLFQVLAFVAMEQPISLDAKPLRDEIAKVFDSITPINPEHVIRGQYDGYLKRQGVAPDSKVETFVALRADIENTRWKDVPFFLRTGKSMAQSRQVVTIGFKEPVMRMFPVDHMEGQRHGNELVADFADPGSIQTHFLAKQPGPGDAPRAGGHDLPLRRLVQTANDLEAYEHLILEAMLGNQAFFTRSDGIERQWEIATPGAREPARSRALRAGVVGTGLHRSHRRAGPVVAPSMSQRSAWCSPTSTARSCRTTKCSPRRRSRGPGPSRAPASCSPSRAVARRGGCTCTRPLALTTPHLGLQRRMIVDATNKFWKNTHR